MVQQSVYTEDEIIDLINSDDMEDNTIGARNLWTFWEQWENKEKLISTGDRLFKLLDELKDETKTTANINMRPIWHYLLALGSIQYMPAIPLIKSLLLNNEVVENVRGFAAETLTRYPPGVVDDELEESLWTLAQKDPSLPVRVNSFRALGHRYAETKDAEVAKKLWKAMKKQQNSAIKSTIIAMIGQVGSKVVVPDLIHMLITRRTGAMKNDAGLALDMIAKINGMDNRDDLIKSMADIEME